MHFPALALALALTAALTSTALALPVLDPSTPSTIQDTDGNWRLPFSLLFPPSSPPVLNATAPAAAGRAKRSVIKNPKVVLNPKNPWYSSSAREAAAAAATKTSTTARTTSSTVVYYPAPPTTTTRSTTTTTTTTSVVKVSTTTREVVRTPSTSTTTTTTTQQQPPPTTRSMTTTTTTTQQQPPTTTTSSQASSTTSTAPVAQFTGQATYFYQYGAAGACGNYNPDTAKIVALDSRLYGNMGQQSQYCGRELTITNTANGKSVVATVADACPGCASTYSLDLSLGAFEAIGDLDTGVLPIVWSWNSAT